MIDFLRQAGVKTGQHILVHSSFRDIRSAFPYATPDSLITLLQELVTESGSLLMPAFTYCFQKSGGNSEPFEKGNSPSKVGIVSETFRIRPNVIRTASATHSFALWGKAAAEIDADTAPDSPLGLDSPLDWLANRDKSFILLLGVDFTALSFGHYLEIINRVPWHGISPWDHQNVLSAGVSADGIQYLKEIPGCSRSFPRFQESLLLDGLIVPTVAGKFAAFLISTDLLIQASKHFFTENTDNLLCPAITCLPCSERREKLKME